MFLSSSQPGFSAIFYEFWIKLKNLTLQKMYLDQTLDTTASRLRDSMLDGFGFTIVSDRQNFLNGSLAKSLESDLDEVLFL